MKRIFSFAIILMMFGTVLHAAETDSASSPGSSKNSQEQLVSVNSSSGRINQLERRVSSLERELHEVNDSLRDLERDLNDVRRQQHS